MHPPDTRTAIKELLPYCAALALVLLLVQAPRIGSFAAGFLDFDLGYYPAGLAIRSNPQSLYSGARFDESTGAISIHAAANFVNIPLVAWLFVPFTLLPQKAAGIVLLVMNVLLSLVSLVLLLRETSSRRIRWAITLAFATSGPLMNALNLGQTTPLILLLLILMQRSVEQNQNARAGVLLGVIGLIKIPPLLLLLYFVLRKNWRAAGSAVAVLCGALLLSTAIYGLDLHREYVDLVFRGNFGKAIAAHNCQSISSFLARTFTDASLLSWQPMELPDGLGVMQLLLQMIVLALAGSRALRSSGDIPPLHAFIAAGLILLPISWSHYGMWMLPVFAALVASPRPWTLPVVVMLLINFPVLPVWVVRQYEYAGWFRLFVSHMFFGVLLLLVYEWKQGFQSKDAKHRRKVQRKPA